MDQISIGEAIDHLRAELMDARDRAVGSGLQFELADISVEFTVELRREVSAKGAVRAWVASAEGGAAQASARTHKVAFTLRARDMAGRGISIGNVAVATDGLADPAPDLRR